MSEHAWYLISQSAQEGSLNVGLQLYELMEIIQGNDFMKEQLQNGDRPIINTTKQFQKRFSRTVADRLETRESRLVFGNLLALMYNNSTMNNNGQKQAAKAIIPTLDKHIHESAMNKRKKVLEPDLSEAWTTLSKHNDANPLFDYKLKFNMANIDYNPQLCSVYKLKRGLYDLKEASLLWHETLSKTLKELGYENSTAFSSTFGF